MAEVDAAATATSTAAAGTEDHEAPEEAIDTKLMTQLEVVAATTQEDEPNKTRVAVKRPIQDTEPQEAEDINPNMAKRSRLEGEEPKEATLTAPPEGHSSFEHAPGLQPHANNQGTVQLPPFSAAPMQPQPLPATSYSGLVPPSPYFPTNLYLGGKTPPTAHPPGFPPAFSPSGFPNQFIPPSFMGMYGGTSGPPGNPGAPAGSADEMKNFSNNARDPSMGEKAAASVVAEDERQQVHGLEPDSSGKMPANPFQNPGQMLHPPPTMMYPPFFMQRPPFAPPPMAMGNMNPLGLVPKSRGIPLAMSCDVEQLSDYQILVRMQLELFQAGREDVDSNTQGRKKPVSLGQVGLRCRHCASFPLRARGRGAVYYPAKLDGIYQAAQNMAGSHLCHSCQHIPPKIREDIRKLRLRKDNASGGKQYWADGCRVLGLYETDSGLRLGPPSGP